MKRPMVQKVVWLIMLLLAAAVIGWGLGRVAVSEIVDGQSPFCPSFPV